MKVTGLVLVGLFAFSLPTFSQPVWISGSFGAAQNEFYDLTDYISGFGDDISSGQPGLVTEIQLATRLKNNWGAAVCFSFDLADLSPDNQEVITYTYSSSTVSLYPFYRLPFEEGLLVYTGPEFGFTFFNLESAGIAVPLPEKLEGNGYQMGIRGDAALKTGESLNIHLSVGARWKDSDPVSFGNSNFRFTSLDAYIRFGILVFLIQ